MPRARCMHYDDSGAPLKKGCLKIGTCQFVHPSEPTWARAPRFKTACQGSWSTPVSGTGIPTGPRKRREPDSGCFENVGANTRTKSNQRKSKERDLGRPSSNTGDPPSSGTTGWEQRNERSGSPGWGNSSSGWGNWDNSSPGWGNSASGWGDTSRSGWGDTNQSGWGDPVQSDPGDMTKQKMESTETASSIVTAAASESTQAQNQATIHSTRRESIIDSFILKSSDPRGTKTTSSSTRGRTNDNQAGGSSWGNSDFITSPAPAQTSVSAPARSPSAPAGQPFEESYESPRANLFEDSAMDVDVSEPQAERQSLASPPPIAAQIPKTPQTEDLCPNSSKDRKRSRSCSPEVQKTFTRSDYVRALIESTVCQYQYDQAHSAYNKHKALQHSKAYSNAGPLAIKMLTQQGDEYAEKLEQMQNWRTKAAKRLVAIAGYYHDTSMLPLDWEHAEDADPVEFVGKSIEEVKAWVNKAVELLTMYPDDLDPGRVRDSSSAVLSAAAVTTMHEILLRLSVLEEQVEDQHLMQVQADNSQTSDDSVQDKTEPTPSVHTKMIGLLRSCRERKAQVDASLRQVQQDMIPILDAHRNCQEEHEQVREEHKAINARMAMLEREYLENQDEVRGNKAEIEKLFSHFREAEEARKRALDPVDPAVLVEQLRPSVVQVAHEEMRRMSSAVTDGFTESLAMVKKQTVDSVWVQMGPVAKLAAAIRNFS